MRYSPSFISYFLPVALAIKPARVSTTPSTKPLPAPGLEEEATLLEEEEARSPNVEAATWGRPLSPGKSDPTSLVTLGRAF